jgi:hypothetical protein
MSLLTGCGGVRSLRHALKTRWILAGWTGACLGWLGAATPGQAQPYPPSWRPAVAASSNTELEKAPREELAEELQRAPVVPAVPPQPYMREIYWRDVMGRDFDPATPAFIRDSLLQIVSRTYYMSRENFDGSRSRAWAGGGWIAYRSGLIGDVLGIQAAFYTSQRLYGPFDESGTRLLNPDQKPLNMLGQAFGRMVLFDQEFRGGRQLIDTPLINPQDNRMVPNTFSGATWNSVPEKDRNYDYVFGYLWNVKQRDSNDFISMSDALVGDRVFNEGAYFGMIKYRPFTGLSLILMDYNIEHFINSGFAQAEYAFPAEAHLPKLSVGANLITQRSFGPDVVGYAFSTHQASGKVQVQYAGWTAFAAASATGDDARIFSPFGTKPNYTDMQQVSFDNPGEKAAGASIAYDFKELGLSGLTAGAWYTKGWDAVDPLTAFRIPDRRELDLWIQYRPSEGPFKGLRAKLQYGNVWQRDNVRDTQPEFRAILDYTILFRNP